MDRPPDLFPSVTVLRDEGWVTLGENGAVYVTEANEKGVLELSALGAPQRRIGSDVLKGAQGVAVAGRLLYVADSEANVVAVYDLETGKRVHPHSVRTLGKYGAGPGELRHPVDVALTRGGNVLVCERLNKRVQELSADGAHIRTFGDGPGGHFRLLGEPRGVAACPHGRVFAVDAPRGRPGRVLVWGPDGSVALTLGPALVGRCAVLGAVDGAMLDPCGVCCAPGGTEVFVVHTLGAGALVGRPAAEARGALRVVSRFCAETGAWRGALRAGDEASGGVAAGRGGALVSATRAGLALLPRGSAFPAHGLDWARARVLWAGALLGAADACLLARLPRDGARGCPLLARIVRLVGAA